MTDTVHKFPLYPLTYPHNGVTDVALPDGAVILHVADQPGAGPCIWVHLDDALAADVVHRFAIVGTGHPVPDAATYIGTWLQGGGVFVWHLYELAP